MRYFLILLFCVSALYADTIGTIDKPLNKTYSHKSYPPHGLSFKDKPAKDFNNTTITGSCFFQEFVEGDATVVKDIFPAGMTGVIFYRCNLDNIFIPIGNTVIIEGADKCTNKRLKVENDHQDWILDNSLKPIEPINKDIYNELGLSIDPKDIPAEKPLVNPLDTKRDELEDAKLGVE